MIKLNTSLNCLISIEVPEEESVVRLLNRGLTSGRSDDNELVIKKRLKEFPQVAEVNINKETETVEIVFSEGVTIADIKSKLSSMGYPEKIRWKGSANWRQMPSRI